MTGAKARFFRRRRVWLLAPALANFLTQPLAAANNDALEYAVKATYLYKFGPFVEWPPAALAASNPVQLCVVGADPFGHAIDDAVAGQKIGDHAVVLRRMDIATRDSGCQIMFIGGSEAQSIAAALAAVHGTPVLTVTDAGAAAHGIISFVLDNARVRFDIDAGEAAQNGIVISSKLLSLAHSVRPVT